MRGVHSVVDDIRRQVFTEVARLAYEGGDYSRVDRIPYTIVPGEIGQYRSSVFLERAIVTERVRLACGLPLQSAAELSETSRDIAESAVDTRYYEPPLVNIISFACNACPPKEIRVSSNCQGCLSHPCRAVCPRDAIIIGRDGKSSVDQTRCIQCGRCLSQCPYNAISRLERPCARACGMCLVNCPFAAIADKSQIFQIINAIRSGREVIACMAPAFAGQFGPNVTPARLRRAMRLLGFSDVAEVAVGADLCTIEEARDFLEKVPAKQPFMATSCCPAWSVMAKKLFPEFREYISMALTPMVLTARMVKKQKPEARIVFVGPCAAKKLEASRQSVRSDVDFVLTFEELQGMFDAKGVDFSALEDDPEEEFSEGTGAGRGFAVGGNVSRAVVDAAARLDPDRVIPTSYGDGLRECRKMLTLARSGKLDGYLLEGMGCPGGCVAGAGTITPVNAAGAAVRRYQSEAERQNAMDSGCADWLKECEE